MFWNPVLFENTAGVTIRGVGFLGNLVDVSYDAASILFTLRAAEEVQAKKRAWRRMRGPAAPTHPLAVADLTTNATYALTVGSPLKLALGPAGFMLQHA
jgi:hypothetical protein